jgi:HTH-type transcriptional regulator/antitoxin HigA
VIDGLMSVRNPSADQLEYLELLTTLVEDYEAERNPTPTVPLAELVKHLIEAKEVAQVQVAKETGVSASTISDVLAGRRSLSIANIKRLAEYFGVEAGVFVRASQ